MDIVTYAVLKKQLEDHEAQDSVANLNLSNTAIEGQTIVVDQVDSDGTPLAWKAVDAPKDGVSPTHAWVGTTLFINSASGTSGVDLKGEAGTNGTNGITPVIGANGNWMIGEEDTGVLADAANVSAQSALDAEKQAEAAKESAAKAEEQVLLAEEQARVAKEAAQAMAGTFDYTGYLRYKIVDTQPTTYDEGVLYLVPYNS